MRRIGALTLAVFALALASGMTAYALPDENLQPPCADIVSGGFAVNNGAIEGSVDTADGTSCSTITYTLHATFTGPSGREQVRSQSVRGNDAPGIVRFTIHVPPSVTSGCAFVTTSGSSGVIDSAPDSGCEPFGPGSPGGGAYN